jgi:manganese-transporting P-type ATPase
MLVLAGAQSLMNVDGELVGDPLEKAGFVATGWLIKGTKNSATYEGPLPSGQAVIKHVYKHHFSSELKRMSVIAKVTSRGRGSEHYVLTKGAPEILKPLLKNCPEGFDAAYGRHAAQGGRVIALAVRKLDANLTTSELINMEREQVCVCFGSGLMTMCF